MVSGRPISNRRMGIASMRRSTLRFAFDESVNRQIARASSASRLIVSPSTFRSTRPSNVAQRACLRPGRRAPVHGRFLKSRSNQAISKCECGDDSQEFDIRTFATLVVLQIFGLTLVRSSFDSTASNRSYLTCVGSP